jgi:hypothetical protein
MTATARHLQVYEELATWYDRQGQAKLRDWFLVLAADTALALGQVGLAERLRQRLLHVNPHHLLRPFGSFAEALQSPDVQGYVADLRRNYPLETAEQLLHATPKKPPAAVEEPELKVYRGQATPVDSTPPAPPPRPAVANASGLPTPARKPMPTPVAWTRPPAPAPRPTPPPTADTDEEPTAFSYGVATLLWVLTLLLGVGLAVYVLARPWIAA